MQLIAVILYVAIIFAIGVSTYRRNLSSTEYILGGRQMNFYLTAMAAHASDMSSWLFLAYPATIYTMGLSGVWTAIGLTLFMYLNWQFVAPKIRVETEKYGSMTFSSFFESRLSDTSGWIRILTALMLLIFYTIYISAGLMGLGILTQSLFGIEYWLGVTIGVCIVIPYLFIAGYITLAYTDLFQGIFLLIAIVMVPLAVFGNFSEITTAAAMHNISMDILPKGGWIGALFVMLSWGLGYFGQPHIVTKFMGISDPKEIHKAKYVGMSWQIIALGCSTLFGLLAIPFFKHGIGDPQLIFVRMTEQTFSPFISAFILCAILGATITVTDSQILVVASSLAEDFYKRIFRKGAGSREILVVTRVCVFIVAVAAYCISLRRTDTIFELVSYAWFGLGSAFGPLLIFSLYWKKVTKQGAWAGIVVGGVIAGVWPLTQSAIPTLVPGFFLSCLAIWIISQLTQPKEAFHEE